MNFRVHRVSAGDAGLFASVADVFDEAINPAGLTAYLEAPGHLMVLALDGDFVVGQCAGVMHYHPRQGNRALCR